MKKNKILILSNISILLLMIAEFILRRNSAGTMNLALKDLCMLLIITIVNIRLKENNYIKISFSSVAIINLLMACVFNSFDSITFFLVYAFLILTTVTFMMLTKNRFEIALVCTVSILITLFIIIGLINVLKFSKLFLLIITITSLIYLFKNKKKSIEIINNINPKSFIIFTILFLVAILGGVGRYIHSWDEYSYWAYAAKVCINEKSLYAVIEKLGNTRNYPPVSTIWHYFISSFSKGFNEPNLYIGLTTLVFIYIMPLFTNILKKDNKIITLFVISTVSFPLLFSGAYMYSLIYVDLLLAIMCTSAIVLFDLQRKGEINRKVYVTILVLITLLKPNGFVFSFTLLLLFYLRDVMDKKINIKSIFKELKKYIIPGILVGVAFISWTLLTKTSIIKSTSYDYSLMPAALKATLGPKLEKQFLLNFINKLLLAFDSSITFSFIEIPLFVYLIITGIFIYKTEDAKEKKTLKSIIPYVISFIVFYLITALSLFVMFSKYEAENLASFGRYLAPILIAYFLFAMYRLATKKNEKALRIICIIIIGFVGFMNTTFFITDIRARRNTGHVKEAREESFREVINNTEKNAKVFVINQADEDSIMPLWYARYYCYPRVINSSSTAITWKIKTKENAWDLKKWGLTDKKLEQHLIDYDFDYIFFYTQTDEMKQELDEYVDEAEEFEKGKLFKIIKVDKDNIKFELVK